MAALTGHGRARPLAITPVAARAAGEYRATSATRPERGNDYVRRVAGHLAPGAFVLLGLLGALIAHGKGRSLLGWLALGLLFGPFTLVASMLVRRSDTLR